MDPGMAGCCYCHLEAFPGLDLAVQIQGVLVAVLGFFGLGLEEGILLAEEVVLVGQRHRPIDSALGAAPVAAVVGFGLVGGRPGLDEVDILVVDTLAVEVLLAAVGIQEEDPAVALVEVGNLWVGNHLDLQGNQAVEDTLEVVHCLVDAVTVEAPHSKSKGLASRQCYLLRIPSQESS